MNNESLIRKSSTKPLTTQNMELNNIIESIENMEPTFKSPIDNVTAEERKALLELKNETNLIFKKADKGGAIVMMDKYFCRDTLVYNGHLNTDTYSRVEENADKKVYSTLSKFMNNYPSCATKDELKCILTSNWKTSEFYVLPKIHKCKNLSTIAKETNEDYIEIPPPSDLTGRPIIGGPNAPTQGLSALIEKILTPIVPFQKSFIKDDWDFLRKLPRNIPYPCRLFSCDIKSLYTSIPIDLGLRAIDYWVTKKRDLIPSRFSKEFILKSTEFVLLNNNFKFNNQMYHQDKGTAMGTIMAPPYACLTVGFLEETILFPTILPQYFPIDICDLIEDLYNRFMDDGFTPLPDEVDPEVFKSCMNSLHSDIIFTIECGSELEDGKKMLSFLDVLVTLNANGDIETEIYYKETNSHHYLNFNSQHPRHILYNIPYNLAKRIIVFTSDSNKMEKHLEDLKKWLLKCQYPIKVIKRGIHNARLQGPSPCPTPRENVIPFVTTNYGNMDMNNITSSIKKKLANTKDDRLQDIFKESKIVLGLRQPMNLYRHLIKSTYVDNPQNPELGLHKCENKRCQICALYLQECNSFKTANEFNWEIRCHIGCNSTNVIYYLVCNMCNVMSYTGKTNNLRSRTNNHISSCRNGSGTNVFDNHVYQCGLRNNCLQAPYFKLFAFIRVSDESKLLSTEQWLHSKHFDTFNR